MALLQACKIHCSNTPRLRLIHVNDSATITAIEVQKRNKNRLSIYLDDDFAFGLDSSIVVEYDLKKGDRLSGDQITNILLKEEKKRVKQKAYRYLAGRAHSEKELRDKLTAKGFEKKLIDSVIVEFKDMKLVEDCEFALAYARSRLLQKPIGENLLRRELWQKGIGEDIIDRTVQSAYSEKSQSELVIGLVKKRKSRYQGLDELTAKKNLGDFLVQRGFDWELAKEVLDEVYLKRKEIE